MCQLNGKADVRALTEDEVRRTSHNVCHLNGEAKVAYERGPGLWVGLGWMVTRLAWIAVKLVSETRYASALLEVP